MNADSGKPGEPMLYARLNENGTAFEPQRNLMKSSFGLDGGGSIAADAAGNVYVTWHGIGVQDAAVGLKGEARRQVWIAVSRDGGKSFQPEKKAWQEPTGACACCAMEVFADRAGTLFAMYRSATEDVHRDIYLLQSSNKGETFSGKLLHKWEINACPMSSMDFAECEDCVVAAWETGGQVYWAPVAGKSSRLRLPVAAPGEGKGRKHPRVAFNRNGELLLVWTEGTGWQRGGALTWQVYNAGGEPIGDHGTVPGLPVWSFAAPVANSDGSFQILY
jgi:hypothetical protein